MLLLWSWRPEIWWPLIWSYAILLLILLLILLNFFLLLLFFLKVKFLLDNLIMGSFEFTIRFHWIFSNLDSHIILIILFPMMLVSYHSRHINNILPLINSSACRCLRNYIINIFTRYRTSDKRFRFFITFISVFFSWQYIQYRFIVI